MSFRTLTRSVGSPLDLHPWLPDRVSFERGTRSGIFCVSVPANRMRLRARHQPSLVAVLRRRSSTAR